MTRELSNLIDNDSKPKRILIVDDEPYNLMAMKIVLK